MRRPAISFRRAACAVALFLAVTLAGGPVQAVSYHVVLCGSGGEEEFSKLFREWGTRLRDALVMRMGVPAGRVVLLTEAETDNAPEFVTTNIESIRSIFEAMADRVTEEDDLFIYFVGHGSYLKSTSKFHIPGPDLSADELGELLSGIAARRLIILNSTSSSAGFINVLSSPDRVICTATKSVSESNATEFMGFFIEGLEDGSADRNHDDRISFLEACEQASELTASWYSAEGFLATEHAILDDNGDGLGSRLPIEVFSGLIDDPDGAEEVLDGALARQCFLKDYSFPESVPQELIDTYLATLEEVEILKAQKAELAVDAYFAELERLLIRAARTNRDIRSHAAPSASDS